MIEREVGKMAAFRAAGFRTADIVYRGANALVLENLGRTLGGDMSDARGEPDRHDALLRAASEIGGCIRLASAMAARIRATSSLPPMAPLPSWISRKTRRR